MPYLHQHLVFVIVANHKVICVSVPKGMVWVFTNKYASSLINSNPDSKHLVRFRIFVRLKLIQLCEMDCLVNRKGLNSHRIPE